MAKAPKSLDLIIAVVITIILCKLTQPLYGGSFLLLFFIYKLYTTRFRTLAIIGKLNFDKGNTDKAIHFFEKAIAVPKCSGGIKSSYAFLLFTIGKIDEAYEVISHASADNPREVMSFNITKACITWRKGLRNEAIEVLEKAHSEGKSSGIYEFLGYYYALNGDLDKALTFNHEAIDYDKDNKVIRDNLGRTYFELNNYEEALKVYEPLLSESPKFLDPYYYTSKIYLSMGLNEKALNLLDQTEDIKDNFMTILKKEDVQKLREELKVMESKEEVLNTESTPALETASDTEI